MSVSDHNLGGSNTWGRLGPVLSVFLALSCGGKSESDDDSGNETPSGDGGANPNSAGGGSDIGGLPGSGGSADSGGSGGSADSGGSSSGEECPASVGSCVRDCFDLCAPERPICNDGVATCPEGQVLRSTCPEEACCSTLSHCCNSTTGEISQNPCGDDGLRAACPEGTVASNDTWCIPDSLGVDDCSALDEQPCDGDVERCTSFVRLETDCRCNEVEPNTGDAAWSCAYSAGP